MQEQGKREPFMFISGDKPILKREIQIETTSIEPPENAMIKRKKKSKKEIKGVACQR